MTDENLILQNDTFADETMRLDFAASPDGGAGLDFHKRTDLRFIADFAPVKVHEVWRMDANIRSELDGRIDGHENIQ